MRQTLIHEKQLLLNEINVYTQITDSDTKALTIKEHLAVGDQVVFKFSEDFQTFYALMNSKATYLLESQQSNEILSLYDEFEGASNKYILGKIIKITEDAS